MELLVLLALTVAAVASAFVHRHHRLALWQRELEQAFGPPEARELPRHRTL
jgi:hypothetical protein